MTYLHSYYSFDVENENWLRDLESKVSDRKSLKLMNRRDKLLLYGVHQLRGQQQLGNTRGSIDEERMGCFAAINNTQLHDLVDYFMIGSECINQNGLSFNSAVFGSKALEKINPVITVQALINNGLAQVNREFQIKGPSSCFYDAQYGSVHALNEALFQLETGALDCALLIASFAPFNPFNVLEQQNARGQTMKESVVALDLRKDLKTFSMACRPVSIQTVKEFPESLKDFRRISQYQRDKVGGLFWGPCGLLNEVIKSAEETILKSGAIGVELCADGLAPSRWIIEAISFDQGFI